MVHTRESNVPENVPSNISLAKIDGLLKLTYNNFAKAIYALIPDTVIEEDIAIKIIAYFLDNYENSIYKTKAFIHWVTGLLEYNLIDFDTVNLFYFCYYRFLELPTLAPLGCKLIHFLTKDPLDVTRALIEEVKSIRDLGIAPKHMEALLTLFKSLRPDLLPEYVPTSSLSHTFPRLPLHFQSRLENRVNNATMTDLQLTKNIVWNIPKNKKSIHKTIPDVVLIHLKSIYEKQLRKKIFLQYDDFVELAVSDCSLKQLSNATSLISNFVGRHLLTFGDNSLKLRCIYYIIELLTYEMSQTSKQSVKNLEEILDGLYELFNYSQQPIPILTTIITEYFNQNISWELNKTMLNILSWQHVTSFDQLYSTVLNPLKNLLITRYDAADRCDIIECVRNLVLNFFMSTLYPDMLNLKTPFSIFQSDNDDSSLDLEQPEYIFKKLGHWVSMFSEEALKVPGPGVLFSVMYLHETLTHLQMRIDPVICSGIISPSVAYTCLVSGLQYLDMFCGLLTSYRSFLETDECSEDEKQQITNYETNFRNILFEGGVRFSEIKELKEYWVDILESNKLSPSLNNNFFTVVLFSTYLHKSSTIPIESMLELCAAYFPNILSLVREI